MVLVGEQIPYLAQVFQMIDIYDALTSERPYKPALTLPEALRSDGARNSEGLA